MRHGTRTSPFSSYFRLTNHTSCSLPHSEAGTDTAAKKEYRKTYLPTEGIERMPLPGADGWLSGKTVQFEPVEKEVVPKPDAVRSRVDGSVEKA